VDRRELARGFSRVWTLRAVGTLVQRLRTAPALEILRSYPRPTIDLNCIPPVAPTSSSSSR
jgi:hypothetical protein